MIFFYKTIFLILKIILHQRYQVKSLIELTSSLKFEHVGLNLRTHTILLIL